MNKYLVVGLGNIGAEYAHTRHNIGFDVADAFARKHDGGWRIDRLAEVSEVKMKGRLVLLIKPTTYMNLSGRAFKYWQEKEKIALENTFTIVDDLALPLSKLRIRPSGSDAGHNGLKDIQLATGTDAFPKLRFGIGSNYPKGRQADFVLSRWLPGEEPVVKLKTEVCVEIIEQFVLTGIGPVMTKYNAIKFGE
jgi:PTH1 family peptidyl-tRNA hydrolase